MRSLPILAVTLLAVTLLAGCATKWSHPNGGANWNADLYQCEQQAAASYPPAMSQVMTSPGYQAPAAPVTTNTNCRNTGFGTVQCQSTQQGGFNTSIYNSPPTYMTVDNNANARGQSVRQCLRAKGYQAN